MSDRPRVAILTLHYSDNYGAMAQAYALQQVLRQQGYDVKLVNYACDYLRHPFRMVNFKTRGLVRQVLTFAGELSRLPRKKKLKIFREMYFNMTETVTKEQLPSLNDKFDLFIAGSDQIWNVDITHYDGAYFLDFVNDYRKKGSYAASFGTTSIRGTDKQWYTEKLKNFCYFNTRESSGSAILQQITGRNSHTVLDPTLLLDKHAWETLAASPSVDGPYILTYQVGMDRVLLDYASMLSKKFGYPVYSIPLPQGKWIKTHPVLNAGIEEWLGWIMNARYVVTDSFHGLALSLALEKNVFVCYSPREEHKSARQRDLLAALGIENRDIRELKGDIPPDMDMDVLHDRMGVLREYSLDVLLRMVEGRLNESEPVENHIRETKK